MVFTAMLWIPHILQRILEMKPYLAFRDPRHDNPTKAAWAQRAIRVRTNAVENLASFGFLVIALEITNSTTATTAIAAAAYFYIRVIHYFVYLMAVPWARTPVFFAGWICQLILVAILFGLLK